MGNYIYYGYTFSRSTIISEPAVKIVEAIPEIVNHEEVAITAPVVEEQEVKEQEKEEEVKEQEEQEVQEVKEQEKEQEEQEKEVEVKGQEEKEDPIVHPYLLEYGTNAISSNIVVIQQQTYEIRKRKNKKD